MGGLGFFVGAIFIVFFIGGFIDEKSWWKRLSLILFVGIFVAALSNQHEIAWACIGGFLGHAGISSYRGFQKNKNKPPGRY